MWDFMPHKFLLHINTLNAWQNTCYRDNQKDLWFYKKKKGVHDVDLLQAKFFYSIKTWITFVRQGFRPGYQDLDTLDIQSQIYPDKDGTNDYRSWGICLNPPFYSSDLQKREQSK